MENVFIDKAFVRALRKNFRHIVENAKISIAILPGFVYNNSNVARATVTVNVEGNRFPERRTLNHVYCKFHP